MTDAQDTTVTVPFPTARTPDESPEIKKEFTRIAQKYGIPKDNVLDITKTGRFCYLYLLFQNFHVTKRTNPKEWNASIQSSFCSPENSFAFCLGIGGGWCLSVLCSASADRCLQARDNQAAQDSRLVMSDGEGLAQGLLPSGTLGVRVQGLQ